MNRMEFMRELEGLLADIPEGERNEALQYYEDYLNDAGVENEQGAMEELGTPEEIARHIKAGLNGNEEGAFTENGYEHGQKEKNPLAMPGHFSDDQKQSETPQRRKGNGVKTLLIVLLLVLFSPVIFSFILAILGIIVGAVAAVGGVWIGFFVAGIALLIAGFCCLIVGIVKLFMVPLAGALLTGIGLLLLGIGLLVTMLMLWMAWKLVPPVMRGFVNLIQKPFRRKVQDNVQTESQGGKSMKKFVKVLIIVAVACVVLGSAITVGAVSVGGVETVEQMLADGELGLLAGQELYVKSQELRVEAEDIELDWDKDDWDDKDDHDDWDDKDDHDDWDDKDDHDDDDWDVVSEGGIGKQAEGNAIEKLSLESVSLTAEETAQVQELKLDMKGGVLQILQAEDGCIRAEANDPYHAIQLGVNGNTFWVKDKIEKKLYRGLRDLDKRIVRLYLPKDMKLEDADIDIGGGVLEADLLSAKKVDLDVGAGKLVMKQLECDKMDGDIGAGSAEFQNAQIFDAEFDIGAGEMNYQGSIGKTLELDCGVGAADFELTDREVDFNYELSAEMGEVVVSDMVFSGMKEKHRIDNGAARYMELDCAMGSIALSF